MVGVVNPTKDKTLAIQKLYAANSTLQLVPGDPWPSETASTPDPRIVPPTTDSAPSTESSSSSSSLGTGAIAGIAIGGAAVVLLGAALIYLCGRRGGFERAYRKTHGTSPTAAAAGMAENKYQDPKSPGMATMSSFDPYRSSTQPSHLGYAGTPPPPMSPGMPGYGSYPSPGFNGHYAPVSDNGSYSPHMQAPYHPGAQQNSSPLASPAFQPPHFTTHAPPPVELAASVDVPTGNSPPPQYGQPDRPHSPTTGAAGSQYRSSGKGN